MLKCHLCKEGHERRAEMIKTLINASSLWKKQSMLYMWCISVVKPVHLLPLFLLIKFFLFSRTSSCMLIYINIKGRDILLSNKVLSSLINEHQISAFIFNGFLLALVVTCTDKLLNLTVSIASTNDWIMVVWIFKYSEYSVNCLCSSVLKH
jgi:hypothetical protein